MIYPKGKPDRGLQQNRLQFALLNLTSKVGKNRHFVQIPTKTLVICGASFCATQDQQHTSGRHFNHFSCCSPSQPSTPASFCM